WVVTTARTAVTRARHDETSSGDLIRHETDRSAAAAPAGGRAIPVSGIAGEAAIGGDGAVHGERAVRGDQETPTAPAAAARRAADGVAGGAAASAARAAEPAETVDPVRARGRSIARDADVRAAADQNVALDQDGDRRVRGVSGEAHEARERAAAAPWVDVLRSEAIEHEDAARRHRDREAPATVPWDGGSRPRWVGSRVRQVEVAEAVRIVGAAADVPLLTLADVGADEQAAGDEEHRKWPASSERVNDSKHVRHGSFPPH